MLSATKHLMRHSNISQTLMNTRNVSSLMKNVSFLVKSFFLALRLLEKIYLTNLSLELKYLGVFAEFQPVQPPAMPIQVSLAIDFRNFLEIFHHHSYSRFFISFSLYIIIARYVVELKQIRGSERSRHRHRLGHDKLVRRSDGRQTGQGHREC